MNLFNYLIERYNFTDNNLASSLYADYLKKEGFISIENEYGFIIYKFQGDACIINDIFINKEYRKLGKSWNLFNSLLTIIKNNENCKILIGFSEFGGKNHVEGIKAMEAAGFINTQYLKDKIVFMRGTQ